MKKARRRPGRLLTRIFFQGLAVILPIAVTAWIIYWLATTTERFLGQLFLRVFPDFYRPGMGMALGLVIVFVVGLMMNAWITRALLARAEAVLERIPVVKSIYGSIRDFAKFLSPKGKDDFQTVVSVALTDDIRLVGFMTRADVHGLPEGLSSADDVVGVYIPMSYQIGGFTVFVPRSAVHPLEMSVEDAMRFTLTAGMSGPRNQAEDAEDVEDAARPAGAMKRTPEPR